MSIPPWGSGRRRSIVLTLIASIFLLARHHSAHRSIVLSLAGGGDADGDLAEVEFLGGAPAGVANEDVAGDDAAAKGRDLDSPISSAAAGTEDDVGERRRMNVVLLYPDDWRHDMLQDETPTLRTPFLSSLAKQGIRFTHNFVTTSLCWVSRATLFSGQYASRHGSVRLRCPHFTKSDRWAHSWPKILQEEANYFVGHVGKWQFWEVWEKTRRMFDWRSLFEGRHVMKVWNASGFGRHVHASDHAASEAIRFLRERPDDRPFALTVAFYPPKPVGSSFEIGEQWSPTNQTYEIYANATIPEPVETSDNSFHLLPKFLQAGSWVARSRWKQRYRTPDHYQEAMRRIYALITGIDRAMEQIVDEIKDQGLYNNTLIVVTADNGMFHSSHGLAGKWYPYQESIRVPLIIYDPRMPKGMRGTVEESYTLNVDLASTILGAAGLDDDLWMQGRDISDLYLRREDEHGKQAVAEKLTPWREDFFYEMPDIDNFIPPSTALVQKKWKYIHWFKHGTEQLFDLEDDPLELKDRINDPQVADVLSSLRQRHDELKSSIRALTAEGGEQLNCTR